MYAAVTYLQFQIQVCFLAHSDFISSDNEHA